jgi:hypothetical protein
VLDCLAAQCMTDRFSLPPPRKHTNQTKSGGEAGERVLP